MLLRRLLITLPVLALFALTSVVFLAAHAPRTWAAHWSPPITIGKGAGQGEYGAVRRPAGWDVLWYDDDRLRLMYMAAGFAPVAVQNGEIVQPTMVQSGSHDLGVWINNVNGSSEIVGAALAPGRLSRHVLILKSVAPIEHPYLFRAASGVDLVFSWQGRGAYEQYLIRMGPALEHPTRPVRLNSAPYYSYYPRAAADATGAFGMVYLDSCCRQEVWNVVYQAYSPAGLPVGAQHVLYRIVGYGNGQEIPGQWGEDIRPAGHGTVLGTFVGDGGIWVFKANTRGQILLRPRLTNPLAGAPESLALVPTGSGAVIFWEQANELGTFVVSQPFDSALQPLADPERVEYVSGSQTNPRGALLKGRVTVVWQTVSRGLASTFQTTQHEVNVQPSIAQRLGLGLGNPWQSLAVLIVGALGVATLTTTGNILLVFALGFAGLIAMRLMRSYPGRWVTYSCLLTLALYFSFVTPGGPVLFLDTIPSMGLAAMPFGFFASVGALGFVTWVGTTALKRVDDLYRVGIMAFLGVYFFAFVEATVFIQQRMGFI